MVLDYHIDAIFMNGNEAKDYCDLVFGDYYNENNVHIEVHYTRDNEGVYYGKINE